MLETVCQQCHSSPPKRGAPFSLVTYGDTQATLDGHPISYWMERFVSTREMPLPPVTIPDNDRETLLAWLRSGAPARGAYDSCEPPTVSADTGVTVDTIPADTGVEDTEADAGEEDTTY